MKIRILIAGLFFMTTALLGTGNVWADGYRGRDNRGGHGSDRYYYNKHRPNRGYHQPPSHWKRGHHDRGKWKGHGYRDRHDGYGRHGRHYDHERPYRKQDSPKHYSKRHHRKYYRYYSPLPHHFLGLSIFKPGFTFSIRGYDR